VASVRKIETEAGGVRWRVRVFVGQDPETRKRTYMTRTFKLKKSADAEATRLEHRKDMGALTAPSKEPLSRYLTRWLDNVKEGRIRARTLHDYRGMVGRYIEKPPEGAPPIGAIRLDRLTPAAFEALYAFLWKEAKLSPRSVQYLHSVLRQALGHAVRTGALPRNPTDAVKPPRQALEGGTPVKAMRAMNREQATRFLKAAAGDEYAALWHVLLLGGLRPGEAFGLTWPDADLEAGKLHVNHSLTRRGLEGWKLVEPKTARARRVVVLPELATRALRAHRVAQAERRLLLGAEYVDHSFVFASTFGAPLDLANVYRRFKGILEAAELGTWAEPETEDGKRTVRGAFRLYDLRHSCATFLLLAGENPKVVAERLGHSTIVLTMDTYSHVLPSMQEASADKLEAMFGGG